MAITVRHCEQHDTRTGPAVVVITGYLNQTAARELEAVAQGLRKFCGMRMVLDLTACPLVNSTGWAVLIECWELAEQVGGRVAICGLEKPLAKVAGIMGLTQYVTLHASLGEAKAAVMAKED